MFKLFLHIEEMMGCQNSSGLRGRGRTGGVLGWLVLFVHWKLGSAALWFTKKYLYSLFWPRSELQLEPVMDLGTEKLKSSISNSVIRSSQFTLRLRDGVCILTFLAAIAGALVRLCCIAVITVLTGSGWGAFSPVCAVSLLVLSVLGCRWIWA